MIGNPESFERPKEEWIPFFKGNDTTLCHAERQQDISYSNKKEALRQKKTPSR